jgi:hypothetical protein
MSLRSTERFQAAHHPLLLASHHDIKSVGDNCDYNFSLRLGDETPQNLLMGTAHWGPAFPDLDPKTPDLGQIMVPNLNFGSKSGILPFLPKSDLFIVQI